MMDLSQHITSRAPLILDGAMGTLLQGRGHDLPEPLWSAAAVESNPEMITAIHREYIDAGAEVITTATFRTTRRIYERAGSELDAKTVNTRAVACAREAVRYRQDVFVAGSVAPLEDCYRPDLVPDDGELAAEHREQIAWLIEAGVDGLLFETMNTIREAETCARIAHDLAFPFFVSFVCDRPGKLLSGESILEAASAIIPFQPLALVINCTHPAIIGETLEALHQNTEYPLGAYANVGHSIPEQGGTIDQILSPAGYLRYVKHWMGFGLRLVGGCCGTTPEHIRNIRDYLNRKPD